MRGISGKTAVTWRKLLLFTLAVAVATALLSTIGLPRAAGAEVNEFVKLRLTSPDPTRQLKADVVLSLHIGEQGGSSFDANTQVAGDELIPNARYDMLLTPSEIDQEGKGLLLDSDWSEEVSEVDPDTGMESHECVVELHLRTHL